MNFSLQLWSIHNETAKDFKKAIQMVHTHGWNGVEFAGFGGLDATQMKELLAENQLYAVGSHTGIDQFENELEDLLAYHQEIGAEYMIIPCAEFKTKEALQRVIDVLNHAAPIAKKYGIKVGYHNHAHEFETMDGKYILDLIAEGTSEDVILEIDVFWVLYAGVDPYKYIEKWGKRVELVHLKQIAADKKTDTILEDGIIDMKKIVDSAKFATHLVVEQEGDVDEVDASKKNIEFLRKIF